MIEGVLFPPSLLPYTPLCVYLWKQLFDKYKNVLKNEVRNYQVIKIIIYPIENKKIIYKRLSDRCTRTSCPSSPSSRSLPTDLSEDLGRPTESWKKFRPMKGSLIWWTEIFNLVVTYPLEISFLFHCFVFGENTYEQQLGRCSCFIFWYILS